MKLHSIRWMFLLAAFPMVTGAAEPAPASRKVELAEVAQSWPAEATVEAVRQATLTAQVQGRVLEVRADAGTAVKPGQLLMRLDARQAAEDAAGAEARLAQAKAQWERNRSLFEKKFISKAALDAAEADYKAARAAAGGAGAGLSYASITAPFAGVVGERLTELGEMAAPGKPLLTVFDPVGMRVVAAVPQYKLGELRGTLKAKVEFPESGRWVDAVRVELLPTVEGRTHTATVRAYLPEKIDGVRPGMFARLHLLTGAAKKIVVPAGAVVRRGEVSLIYVLDDKSAPRLRQVRLGEAQAGGDIEVLAGLAAGETIALDPIRAGIDTRKKP